MPYTPKIFIAYSRKDESLLNELRTHLTPIERSGKVEIWYDGKIEPGLVWEKAIKAHLHAADIILLLVSADAIASDYFYDKEMKDALVRHESGDARVVPLILRPCTWDATPLAKLQAIPKDGLAVTSWKDRDAAFSDAVGSIWEMIQNQIADVKAMKEKEEKERLQKEADAKRELELGKEKAAAAKRKEEQALQMEQLEKEAQIRRQKREALEKEAAAKRAEATNEWITKIKSIIRKPAVWGSAVLLLFVLGAVKMNSGSSMIEEEDIEAPAIEDENLSGKYHFVLNSYIENKKLPTIKVVKNYFGYALKESKMIVENLPYVLKKETKLSEAKKIKEAFRKIGASLNFQPIETEFKFAVSVESLKRHGIDELSEYLYAYDFNNLNLENYKGEVPFIIKSDLTIDRAKEMKKVIEQEYGGKASILSKND